MSYPSSAPQAGNRCQHATAVYAATDDHLAGVGAPTVEAPGSVSDHATTFALDPSCSKQQDSKDSNVVMSLPLTKLKKSVRWSTITVHEFGIGLGGSAVSNKGGPSIGLADTPEFTWTTKVGEMAECVEGVHRFSPKQRTRLLQAAGIPDGIITRHARETNIILGSRRRSKATWDESELDEEEEVEEGWKGSPLRKRSADQAMLERPCAVYLRRPRMIPVNYV
ncbi:hypothetical protein PHMEG_00012021 [Phytophthora megakarya]|uniref:Uncharacterized protein n=1 Tax=Phytophthora megakarya TaxID=4795 RepID=A0A225WA46_9STRA|nr:hypothetical protein PHMEG_00012021 [Phytophthora megakarya]